MRSADLLPDNTYAADPAIRSVVARRLGPDVLEWAEPQLFQLGVLAPRELYRWGEECARQPSWLRTSEPSGERVDEVVYPEAWPSPARAAAASAPTRLPPRAHS